MSHVLSFDSYQLAVEILESLLMSHHTCDEGTGVDVRGQNTLKQIERSTTT